MSIPFKKIVKVAAVAGAAAGAVLAAPVLGGAGVIVTGGGLVLTGVAEAAVGVGIAAKVIQEAFD